MNQETIDDYKCLIKTVDEFLNRIKAKNGWRSFGEMVDNPLIKELSMFTGHSRTYFIHSTPNGNKFDVPKIKEVRGKIFAEIEEYQENFNAR
ncbi:hypothetical protein [Paenibacillus hexagrammi]|uniref:Uncharacterized protein n=1 Tax=Paenibacillus hexagrammi TaxID=2908839 RepID=A0ABY3SNM4_9BACL|nr:hypothetical protein [Paenibacillus sp. YPD9-1]UJF35546.1 hypothetical protein L0M14_10855 [Paenibacillus sp. YPD9-1]